MGNTAQIYTYGQSEKSFLNKQRFENFVSNMDFWVTGPDTSRPDTMFLRIGLGQLGKDKQIGVILEADYRLYRRWFNLPKGIDTDVILTLCQSSSISDRKKMLKEMPVLAEKHISAYGKINDILD